MSRMVKKFTELCTRTSNTSHGVCEQFRLSCALEGWNSNLACGQTVTPFLSKLIESIVDILINFYMELCIHVWVAISLVVVVSLSLYV